MAKNPKFQRGISDEDRVFRRVTLSLGLVTLGFWTSLEDPFNIVKMWILILISASTLGYVLFNLKSSIGTRKFAYFPILAFLTVLTFSAAVTPNKYQAIFGAQARATGWITYICLALVALSVSLAARQSQIKYLEKVVLATGALVTSYGFLQHYGADFIHWNNPYNPVIATLGNPDFSAALFAFVGVMNLGFSIRNAKYSRLQSALHLVVTVMTFVAILFTGVRQGLIALAIGVALLVLVYIYSISKSIGNIAAVGSTAVGALGILGILNHGPLKGLLYKESVSLRGDYWRAALRMMKDHLLSGVGLDSYGDYFRQYRDQTQVLRHGPNVVSNSAHNVVLQLGATGGLVVLICYVLFLGVTTFLGARTLVKNPKSPDWAAAAVFATWIAYLVQSLISIDNIGLSIWGWFTAGMIIYFAYSSAGDAENFSTDTKIVSKSKSRKSAIQKNEIAVNLINSGSATVALLLVISMYLSSSAMYRLQSFQAPKKEEVSAYQAYLTKPTSYGIVNPYFKLRTAVMETEYVNQQSGISKIENIIASSPKGSAFDATNVAANYYEQTGNYVKAETYLKELSKIDALDTGIYLRLLNLYKLNGQNVLARQMFLKIQSIDPRGSDMTAAVKALN